jgi:hypothetical protein
MYLKSNNIIYHYTSLDALFNGILVAAPEKLGEICLWATHSDYLNDKYEIKSCSEMIEDKIKKICNGQFYDRYIETKEVNGVDEIHILSFSKTKDYLPMWSMYGKQGKGIMLGFDFKSDEYMIKCNYMDEKDLSNFIDAKLNKITKNDISYLEQTEILIGMYYQIFAIKSRHFEYEQEIRMVINPNNVIEQVASESNPYSQVDFRVNNNVLVPYFKYYFPKEYLVELWIGPTQNQTLSTNSLRKYLNKYGFDHTKIINSSCPLKA